MTDSSKPPLHPREEGQRRRMRRSVYGERKTLDQIPSIPYLEFGELLGSGHFSHVYKGSYYGNTTVAIKVIERGSETLIANEIDLLESLKGCPGVVQLLEVITEPRTILVFEYLPSLKQSEVLDFLDEDSLRFILRSLLTALCETHKKGILHRDIKGGNISISPSFDSVKIIDWGCGARVSDDMWPKAGSRTVRPPEMLLGYRGYGPGCDIWAIGAYILTILTDQSLPWKRKTSVDTLVEMSHFFGGDKITEYARSLGVVPPEEFEELQSRKPDRDLVSTFDPDMEDLATQPLVDLMMQLLTIDYRQRPTAEEALNHPYFTQNPL